MRIERAWLCIIVSVVRWAVIGIVCVCALVNCARQVAQSEHTTERKTPAGQQDGGSSSASEPDFTQFEKIEVSVDGRWRKGWPWELTINANGVAELNIRKPRHGIRREWTLTNIEFDRLRKALLRSRFHALPSEVGSLVPDCTIRTIDVKGAGWRKTVRAYSRLNLRSEDEWMKMQRFLDCWLRFRGIFGDPDAHDGREYLPDFPTP